MSLHHQHHHHHHWRQDSETEGGCDSPSVYLRPLSPLAAAAASPPGVNSSPSFSLSSDVVKRGYLYVKRPPSKRSVRISIKTWQKRYLILRDDWKSSGSTTLDIYNRESESTSSFPDGTKVVSPSTVFNFRPYTVDLRCVVDVDIYLESRTFVHALIVHRRDSYPIILGADTDLEMKCWYAAIRSLADKVRELGRPPSCPPQISHGVRSPGTPGGGGGGGLNRSSPQLFKVVSTGSLHHVIDRQMSSFAALQRTTPDGAYLDVVGSDFHTSITQNSFSSTQSDPQSNSSRKTSKTAFFSNIGKELSTKWKTFSKSNRKDSGFSESFEESTASGEWSTGQNYQPPEETLAEEDQGQWGDCLPPPPPPVPPRRTNSPFSPPSRILHSKSSEPSTPPRPPPRPLHTLSMPSPYAVKH